MRRWRSESKGRCARQVSRGRSGGTSARFKRVPDGVRRRGAGRARAAAGGRSSLEPKNEAQRGALDSEQCSAHGSPEVNWVGHRADASGGMQRRSWAAWHGAGRRRQHIVQTRAPAEGFEAPRRSVFSRVHVKVVPLQGEGHGSGGGSRAVAVADAVGVHIETMQDARCGITCGVCGPTTSRAPRWRWVGARDLPCTCRQRPRPAHAARVVSETTG
jgi:hypothetical protein